MVALNHTVNTNNLREGDDLLPPGNYVVEITDATMKDTKSGTGQMIVITYRVTEGAQVNCLLTDRFNFWNQNEVAQRIGRAQFDKMVNAAGMVKVDDTNELPGKKLGIKVENRQSQDWVNDKGETVQGKPQNEIKKYFKVVSETAPASTPWS